VCSSDLRISVLTLKLRPAFDGIFLLLISGALCLVFRKKLAEKRSNLKGELRITVVIPIIFLLLFSFLFIKEGFVLLSGGEDELQYAANARHMIEQVHTGSSMDVPVPRIDNWIYDLATRDLPYNQNYRKGAEITLASAAEVSGPRRVDEIARMLSGRPDSTAARRHAKELLASRTSSD
jgi:hypothetical protein